MAAQARLDRLEGVQARAIYGAPTTVLARYSDSLDLLILGSRHRGPLGRLFLGSTSQALALEAGCPLLVLTRAQAPETLGLDEPTVEGIADQLGA